MLGDPVVFKDNLVLLVEKVLKVHKDSQVDKEILELQGNLDQLVLWAYQVQLDRAVCLVLSFTLLSTLVVLGDSGFTVMVT